MEVHVIQPELNESIFGAKTRAAPAASNGGHAARQSARGQRGDEIKRFCARRRKKTLAAKGHGRARAGSIRSPIWVGGGTVFGPQPRDYSYRMPRTARREALLSALSLKNRDGKIIVVDKLELEEAKTKLMVKALAELKVAKRFDRDCRRPTRRSSVQRAICRKSKCCGWRV